MMKKSIYGRAAAIFMSVMLLAGCAPGKQDGAAGDRQTEGTMTDQTTQDRTAAGDTADGAKDSVIVAMGPTSEPESGFNPAYGWGAGEHVHEPLIQSTLTVTTTDLRIDYDLATDMQVSEDGMTWTVKIRDDVKFTDGEPDRKSVV